MYRQNRRMSSTRSKATHLLFICEPRRRCFSPLAAVPRPLCGPLPRVRSEREHLLCVERVQHLLLFLTHIRCWAHLLRSRSGVSEITPFRVCFACCRGCTIGTLVKTLVKKHFPRVKSIKAPVTKHFPRRCAHVGAKQAKLPIKFQ